MVVFADTRNDLCTPDLLLPSYFVTDLYMEQKYSIHADTSFTFNKYTQTHPSFAEVFYLSKY
jgi:hypothetical protein